MTNDEQRMVMGETCEELASLKKNRACLEGRADSFRKQLRRAESILSYLLGDRKDYDSPNEKEWPTYGDILSLFNEHTEGTKQINQLEERLREWKVL